MANPALDYTPQPLGPVWGLHEYGQSWGSESRNIPIGYIEHRKPRWQVLKYSYEDPGAMERFGIDPRNPAQGGMIMSANSYGYPLEGFTTGYSVKLPPSNIGMQAASQVPRSGLDMTVVGTSDGSTPMPQDPVGDMNAMVPSPPPMPPTAFTMPYLRSTGGPPSPKKWLTEPEPAPGDVAPPPEVTAPRPKFKGARRKKKGDAVEVDTGSV